MNLASIHAIRKNKKGLNYELGPLKFLPRPAPRRELLSRKKRDTDSRRQNYKMYLKNTKIVSHLTVRAALPNMMIDVGAFGGSLRGPPAHWLIPVRGSERRPRIGWPLPPAVLQRRRSLQLRREALRARREIVGLQ